MCFFSSPFATSFLDIEITKNFLWRIVLSSCELHNLYAAIFAFLIAIRCVFTQIVNSPEHRGPNRFISTRVKGLSEFPCCGTLLLYPL